MSSAEARPVLVAALSGRALAAAARRAGDAGLVLDLFADQDTAQLAGRCVKLPGAGAGFDPAALLAAVERLAPAARGLVYGAGLEHDPALLAAIAARLPLLGNAPATVAAVKDPMAFARLLARLGLPHPETTLAAPPPGAPGWLAKQAGASGGRHVVPAAGATATPGRYFQRCVAGEAVSALFVADGRAARVLGLSRQWTAPTDATPYRYGGCAGPLRLSRHLAAAITAACSALAAATGLVGLNSLDMSVRGDRFHILELNPRPGATLDIFDGGAPPLWRAHLDALRGRLPEQNPSPGGMMRGAALLYAPAALAVPPAMAWPRWTADRGAAGTPVLQRDPVCTVLATGRSLAAVRAQLEQRMAEVLTRLAAGAAAAA